MRCFLVPVCLTLALSLPNSASADRGTASADDRSTDRYAGTAAYDDRGGYEDEGRVDFGFVTDERADPAGGLAWQEEDRYATSRGDDAEISELAEMLASSQDFNQLVDREMIEWLRAEPTEAVLAEVMAAFAEPLFATGAVSTADEVVALFTFTLAASENPVDAAAAVIANELGCSEDESCLDLGRYVLRSSKAVARSCASEGYDNFEDCAWSSDSESKRVIDAAAYATYEHRMSLDQSMARLEQELRETGEWGRTLSDRNTDADADERDDSRGQALPNLPTGGGLTVDGSRFGGGQQMGDCGEIIMGSANTEEEDCPGFPGSGTSAGDSSPWNNDSTSPCAGLDPSMVLGLNGGGAMLTSAQWGGLSTAAMYTKAIGGFGVVAMSTAAGLSGGICVPCVLGAGAYGALGVGAALAQEQFGSWSKEKAVEESAAAKEKAAKEEAAKEEAAKAAPAGDPKKDKKGDDTPAPLPASATPTKSGSSTGGGARTPSWDDDSAQGQCMNFLENHYPTCLGTFGGSSDVPAPGTAANWGSSSTGLDDKPDLMGPTDGGKDEPICGAMEVCANGKFSGLAVYAKMCGAIDPSPMDEAVGFGQDGLMLPSDPGGTTDPWSSTGTLSLPGQAGGPTDPVSSY